MSRPTDTERGARLALDEALHVLHPDMFPDMYTPGYQELWWGILNAARDELADASALRQAVRHG